MEDRELLELLRLRPAEGLARAVGEYRGLVGAIVTRVLAGRPQDVEEVAADAFVTLWRRAGELDPDRGSLKSYLAVIARNAAIDRLRAIARREGPLSGEAEELLADGLNLETLLEDRERQEALGEVLEGLPRDQREAVLRRYFLAQSIGEIAREMGLGEKQVKNRLYQAKRRMRKELLMRGMEL